MANRIFNMFCFFCLSLTAKKAICAELQNLNQSTKLQMTSNNQLEKAIITPLRETTPTTCKLPDNEAFMIVKNSLNNETIPLGADVPKDTLLLFSCKAGYSLKGFNNTICGSRGRWTKTLPSCISFCSAQYPKSGFSTIASHFELNGIDVSHAQQFEVDTVAKISCANSFNKPAIFENTLVCTENGWRETKVPCEMECGQPVAMITPFSRKGDDAKITEVPWHVGIYEEKNGRYENICGGVLISPRVVVSAAHCFFETELDKVMMDFSKLAVAAGKYYRDFNSESSIETRKIIDIWTPTDYVGKKGYYLGDLAILRLKEFIPFSEKVRPICLFQSKQYNEDAFANLTGKVATWNQFTVNEPYSVLKTLLMSAISLEKCGDILSKDLEHKLPADKFCLASYNQEAVACKGDSGSGFFVKVTGTNAFGLLGIVSFSPTKTHDCTHNNLLVVTNVSYYQHIIEQFKKEDLENDIEGFDKQLFEENMGKPKTCKVPTNTDFMLIKNLFTGEIVNEGYNAPVNTFYAVACESEYVVNGNNITICSPNGYWLDKFPRCVPEPNPIPKTAIAVACKIPAEKKFLIAKNLDSGDLIAPGSIVFKNQTLIFSCETGYLLKGVNNSTCNGNDVWTNGLPFCYFNCTNKHLNSGFSTTAMLDFEDDDLVARMDCAFFYAKPKDFHNILTCTKNGWNAPIFACLMNCGLPEESVLTHRDLGANSNFTEAPWHVAIYKQVNNHYENICGGTLISPSFVVSAARCFFLEQRTNSTKINLNIFSIVAGKYSREYVGKALEMSAVQERKIMEIWTPDDYKGAENEFYADISIIKLDEFIIFTHSIRPACLYLAVGIYQNISSNLQGRIAAWNNFNERRTMHLETSSHSECNKTLSESGFFGLNADKFCLLAHLSRDSDYSIDVGSGFVARNPDGGFSLFGVVSYSLKDRKVSFQYLVAMTNALMYKTWTQAARDEDIKNDIDLVSIKN